MNKLYDITILTHVPSSYKVNLYNEMAKTKRIHVIFISLNSIGRTSDFINSDFNFDFQILNKSGYEERNKFTSVLKLIKTLLSHKANHLIVNGWDMLEFWVSMLMPLKSLKGVAIESTIFETKLTFLHKFIKKLFLSLVDFALPSGVPHAEVLIRLKFKKPYKIVGGVGIPNIYLNRAKPSKCVIGNTFLFLGRLVPEKNLNFLISCFNEMPDKKLHIIGSGPLEQNLKAIASDNIKFTPHIANDRLIEIFDDVKCLVLPSCSETWGLVVEEALYFNKPVIVSSNVGCVTDIVEKYRVGLVFNSGLRDSFIQAINQFNNFTECDNLLQNCIELDHKLIYDHQISAYNLSWLSEREYDNQ
jgi:glycosyltransferase involved in cell wall biosynthesis